MEQSELQSILTSINCASATFDKSGAGNYIYIKNTQTQ